jgi:hypothetical protein
MGMGMGAKVRSCLFFATDSASLFRGKERQVFTSKFFQDIGRLLGRLEK